MANTAAAQLLGEYRPAAVNPSHTQVRAYPLGYLPALDGMRGLMTLSVMAAHATSFSFLHSPFTLPGANILMDSFFVMSGYLITSLLLRDYHRHGGIRFGAFFLRRAARLYPALALMLVAVLLFSLFRMPDFPARLREVAISFFYLSDYWRAFAKPHFFVFTAHTWSLAIEEQFYLLWPLALTFLLRWFQVSWRLLLAIACLALAYAVWRAWLAFDGASISRLYNSFDTRADSLLIGCGGAVLFELFELAKYPRLSKLFAWSIGPIWLFYVVSMSTLGLSYRWYYYIMPVFGALPALVLVAALRQPERTFTHRFFEWAPLVYCGRICYGLYLWHLPLFIMVLTFIPATWAMFAIGWPLAFIAATGSYYLVERHAMRKRPL